MGVYLKAIWYILLSLTLLFAKNLDAKAVQHKQHPVIHKGQLHIDTHRILEIQTALIKYDYLSREPDGKWDKDTVSAMRQLQADNGWQTKLVPDARALKLIGLGADYSKALRGSAESLLRQNLRNDFEGLERIKNEHDLYSLILNGELVSVPVLPKKLIINENLPEYHKYCRPWTAEFLIDLSTQYSAEFKSPLKVSSAVRTIEYQHKLNRINSNSAPAEGDIVSPHLTGASIDIVKSKMDRAEIVWMRRQLASLQNEGMIDVEEEFKQPCFHITVYNNYSLSITSKFIPETMKAFKEASGAN